MIELFLALAIRLGEFEITPPPPDVVVASEDYIKEQCGIDYRGTLWGCFTPVQPTRVFVNESATGVLGVSYVLHEIVHYVQYHNGRMANGAQGLYGCKRWLVNELQAFEVQEAWLQKQYVVMPFGEQIKARYKAACKEIET